MQFQADMLGCNVLLPTVQETTARGAAFLAGLAVGVWSGPEDIRAVWSIRERFSPQMEAADREALLARWHEAVARCRRWEKD